MSQLHSNERQLHIAFIRQKCIAANPNLAEGDTITLHLDGTILQATVTHGIRLADVLLVIDHNEDNPPTLTAEGQFCQYDPKTGVMHLSGKYWDLRKDDLTQQSPECIAFIYNLLK